MMEKGLRRRVGGERKETGREKEKGRIRMVVVEEGVEVENKDRQRV